MKPLILAAGDNKYCDLYGAALRKSAEAHGMECRVFDGGEMSADKASCYRYLLLPELLERFPSILVLDIDSIINESIDFHERWDLGLFLRPDINDANKKVMGSAFYINARAIEFARELKRHLDGDVKWFADQIWLWKLYQRTLGKYKVKLLGTDFINWHRTPASIWTGKGDVKHHDKFVAQLKRYS